MIRDDGTVAVVLETGNDSVIYADQTADRCSVCSWQSAPYSIFDFFLARNIEKWLEINFVGSGCYVLGLPCYDFKKRLVTKRTECWWSLLNCPVLSFFKYNEINNGSC